MTIRTKNTMRCSRCKRANWTCRGCERRFCEHYCTLKNGADKTASCANCVRANDPLNKSRGQTVLPQDTKEMATPQQAPSTLEVIDFQIKQQHQRTLRQAEQVLADVQHLVEALRAGRVPTTPLNINMVAFVLGDHAKLQAQHEMRELAAAEKNAPSISGGPSVVLES